MSENNRKHTYLISAFILLIVIGIIFCTLLTNDFENNEANADNSSFQRAGKVRKATYRFQGGEGRVYSKETFFSDSWFLMNEYDYNHSLAKTSLAISLSAFTSDEARSFWGEDGSFNREANIRQFLDDMDFKNTEFSGYNVNLNDFSSKAAYALGHKTLETKSERADVVCVAIRGGGYGCEWADNFKVGVGESPWHKGFLTSAQKVKAGVDDYIKRNCKTGSLKLWISGYSRGGAIANVLASLYDSEKKESGYEIYAYTFAAPTTIDFSSAEFKNIDFSNIFNIINPYDIVPTIPPPAWGFSRPGKDMSFPLYKEESELFERVSSYYTELTGDNKELFQPSPLKNITDIIVKLGKDRKTYATVFEPILEDLVLSSMTREKNGNEWTVIPFKKYIRQKYGNDAVLKLENLDSNIGIAGFSDLESVLPEDFIKFLFLCQINGAGDITSVIIENLTLKSVHQIAGLGGESIFSGSISGHFPEGYVAWMESIAETDFEGIVING